MLARFGRQSLRHYIISHTETVSDLLEVLLLQKEAGLMHDTLDREPRTDLIVVPLFETIEDLRNAAGHHARLLRAAGDPGSGAAQRRRAGHHAGLLRQQQGRRHLHQQLGAVPGRGGPGRVVRRIGRRQARPGADPAAHVPWPWRHGRTWRRAELPGDPGPAAGHGARPDPPDRTGRGHRHQIRQPGHRTAQPGDPGCRHARSHADAASQGGSASLPRRRPVPCPRPAWRPTASWSTRHPVSPSISSAPRRSARSPNSTSARARPRASRPRRSKTCAPSPGVSAGANAA